MNPLRLSRPARLFVPLALAALTLAPIGCAGNRRTDSVRLAEQANRDQFRGDHTDIQAAEFLVEMADARMTSIEMSESALERSDSSSVQEHARRMITEERALLDDIRTLAAAEEIELPATMSHKSAKDVAKLDKRSGTPFDRRYTRFMVLLHQDDVAAFSRARNSRHDAVSDFAEQHLPQVEQYRAHATELKRMH